MADLIKNINETLALKDSRRGAARAVVSDLLVGTTLSEAEFLALLDSGGAVGYEPFRNFIAGEYDYQDALFKAAFGANAGSSPRALELSVTVDVPDVFDRGSASTSASAVVTVSFARPFNAVPEIAATLKGGTVVATPRISNVTETGFDLELVNVSNARVAGDVSWSAKGY